MDTRKTDDGRLSLPLKVMRRWISLGMENIFPSTSARRTTAEMRTLEPRLLQFRFWSLIFFNLGCPSHDV